eukprot:GILI01001907.1.p1 GENE.GILI01001907.1~~GILI01001907.1.p1  ORF type:complete len:421 (+),score=126.29 GILI01001907.1:54-1316(+)
MSASTAFKLYITITYKGLDAPAPHKTIRRFSAKAGTTLAEFRAILIEEILRRPDGSVAIAVSYKDADGDVVEVMSELEWAEALQQHSGSLTAGTAIPILIDVSMAASQAYPLSATATTVLTPLPSNAHFSPIVQSDDEAEEDNHIFEATNSRESEKDNTVTVSSGPTEVITATESPLADGMATTAALGESQPSTDALLMVDEEGPHDWEEVEPEASVASDSQVRAAVEEQTLLQPTESDEGVCVVAAPQEAVQSSTTSSQATAPELPSQPSSQVPEQHTESQPNQPQQGASQQPQHDQSQPFRQPQHRPFSFLAAPFAWLGHHAHQQLAAQPRANNRYPRYAAEAQANDANRARFVANAARYQKMTGATKSEDIVQLLDLCPAASAEQAQAALEKYNGQVYRAANYLLDTTTEEAPASPQ